jgi:hypothetical protein
MNSVGKSQDAATSSHSPFHRTRILICSDATNENEINFDQKLLFLMKRQNIYLDSVTLGDSEVLMVIFHKF